METIDNIITAYDAVKMNGVSQGVILLCTVIALLIVINKFLTAYHEAQADGANINMKSFYKLFEIYINAFVIIMVAPVAFSVVENCLGFLQNELIAYYQKDLDFSIDEAIKQFVYDYIDEVQRNNNWFGQQLQEVLVLPWSIFGYTIVLYATKYVFFFYASGRYLYLILLEIVTPIAVILYMDKDTRNFTHSYLKNLFICYMLIPAFLIANTFGDLISSNIMHMIGANKYSLLGLLFALIFKLFLFAKAVKYTNQLI